VEIFAGDGRVVYRPMSELLPEASEDAAAELKKGDDDLDEGDKAFSGMELEPAKQRLTAAVERYRAWLPELVKRDNGAGKLQTTWILLAKVYFFDGDAANARTALRHCLTLDAQLEFNKTVFPPQMKKLVAETRMQFEIGGIGRVKIATTPAGATVYVDGVARPAPTPQTIELPAGPHDLRLDLTGRKRVVEALEVADTGATPAELTAALPELPSQADALFAPLLPRLDEPRPPAELARAAQQIGVDLVAVVKATPAGAKVALSGWLYDVRRDLVLKRATRESGGSDEELRLSGRYFARELTTGVRLDGRPEPPPHRDTFAEKWQRFRESKWFWPVVGSVAGLVVTGAAVGIGVGVAKQRSVDDDAAAAVVLTGGR
ncbi:MAG: PEGA domain-containing protein, partial [Polyangia bacterium]